MRTSYPAAAAALLLMVAPLAGQAVQTGSNGGVTVSSADGRYLMKLGGRIQALYQYDSPDAEAARASAPLGARPVEGSRSLFRVRRGRLALSGHVVDPTWQYKVQVELVGSSLSLKDAYVNWRPVGPGVQLRVGQFKVPFGRQELTSVFKQQLVDRSVVSGAFADGWDDGVMVWGEPLGGRVEYYAGVFNGEGINRGRQQDAANEWAARLVWVPVGSVGYDFTARGARGGGGLAIGVNGRWNGGWLVEADGRPGLTGPVETCDAAGCVLDPGDDARLSTVGADLAFRWRRVAVTGEVFQRQVDPRLDGAATRESLGWYADGGAFLGDRYEAGLRYGRLDPDTAVEADRITEVAPFAVVYLSGNDLKLQADYAWVSAGEAATAVRTDRRLRVQFLLTF